MKLTRLHEEFLDKARRPMTFGKLPVLPQTAEVPVVAVNKWKKVTSPTRLHKTFRFMSQETRNEFVSGLFEYEIKTQHNAMITVAEGEVTLDVRTKDIDQVTELDKEYAKWADELYKDVVYSSPNGRRVEQDIDE